MDTHDQSAVRDLNRFALFGPPALLHGENAADYRELRQRLCAALNPADVIDDIYVDDITVCQWEVMRWRRFKGQLLAGCQRALGTYFEERLSFVQYVDVLKDALVDAFRNCQPDLTREQCIEMVQPGDPRQPNYDANFQGEIAKWFINTRHSYRTIEGNAKAQKAADLAYQCIQEGPDSLHKCVVMVGGTVEDFMAGHLGSLYSNPDSVLERVDQRIATLENRRNRAVRELERHKLVWGEIVRQTLKEIENEPEVLRLPNDSESAPSLAPPAMVS